MQIRKVGIVANIHKEKAAHCAVQLRDWLSRRGIAVCWEASLASVLGESPGFADEGKGIGGVDLLLVLGGDGTMLRAARLVQGLSIPIAGVNLGRFGYMTMIHREEMIAALEGILHGRCRLEKRMMLDVRVDGTRAEPRCGTVLNDAVINRAHLSRILELEVWIQDRYLTTFKADGLILSTPTGSTAYSLSAGGPLVFPDQSLMLINPICAHTLLSRPIIVPESVSLRVVLRTKDDGALLTLDGQISHRLCPGEAVVVQKSTAETVLVSLPDRHYVDILRTKLGWGNPEGMVCGNDTVTG